MLVGEGGVWRQRFRTEMAAPRAKDSGYRWLHMGVRLMEV
jgi:hypothetical protein